jgi:hypothetical protein
MSQEGAKTILQACPQRMDSEKKSLEAKNILPEKKGGSFLQLHYEPKISHSPFLSLMRV